MSIAVLIAATVVVAACAKSPDGISAAFISDVTYRPLTCQDLAVESARANQALARASTQQENARSNDTVGVLLIGIPVSSLSGDNIAPGLVTSTASLKHVPTMSKCWRVL